MRWDALRGGTPRHAASVALDLIHCGDAAFADVRIVLAFAYVRRIIPAALALFAVGAIDVDPQSVISTARRLDDVCIVCGDFNLRNDEKGREAEDMFAQYPRQSALAARVTRASRPAEIVFAARRGSSAFRTSSRTERRRSHSFVRASSKAFSNGSGDGK